MKPVIALFTDFGTRDGYSAQMKSVIIGINPGANILDLTHDADNFDIAQASYLLEKSARYLPPGSIIVAVVDPGVGSSRRPVAIRTQAGHVFIGPDNGIFTQVLAREGLQSARVIEDTSFFLRPDTSATFHGRDIFAPAAARLADGASFDSLGSKITDPTVLPTQKASTLGDKTTGQVVFIDHYGNIITNILREHLAKIDEDSLLKVTIKGRTVSMPLLKTYADAPDQRPFLIFNSQDELEIARSKASAAELLKLSPGDTVVIRK